MKSAWMRLVERKTDLCYIFVLFMNKASFNKQYMAILLHLFKSDSVWFYIKGELHLAHKCGKLLSKSIQYTESFILRRKYLLNKQNTHSHMYKTPAEGTAGCHGDEAWRRLIPQGVAGF